MSYSDFHSGLKNPVIRMRCYQDRHPLFLYGGDSDPGVFVNGLVTIQNSNSNNSNNKPKSKHRRGSNPRKDGKDIIHIVSPAEVVSNQPRQQRSIDTTWEKETKKKLRPNPNYQKPLAPVPLLLVVQPRPNEEENEGKGEKKKTRKRKNSPRNYKTKNSGGGGGGEGLLHPLSQKKKGKEKKTHQKNYWARFFLWAELFEFFSLHLIEKISGIGPSFSDTIGTIPMDTRVEDAVRIRVAFLNEPSEHETTLFLLRRHHRRQKGEEKEEIKKKKKKKERNSMSQVQSVQVEKENSKNKTDDRLSRNKDIAFFFLVLGKDGKGYHRIRNKVSPIPLFPEKKNLQNWSWQWGCRHSSDAFLQRVFAPTKPTLPKGTPMNPGAITIWRWIRLPGDNDYPSQNKKFKKKSLLAPTVGVSPCTALGKPITPHFEKKEKRTTSKKRLFFSLPGARSFFFQTKKSFQNAFSVPNKGLEELIPTHLSWRSGVSFLRKKARSDSNRAFFTPSPSSSVGLSLVRRQRIPGSDERLACIKGPNCWRRHWFLGRGFFESENPWFFGKESIPWFTGQSTDKNPQKTWLQESHPTKEIGPRGSHSQVCWKSPRKAFFGHNGKESVTMMQSTDFQFLGGLFFQKLFFSIFPIEYSACARLFLVKIVSRWVDATSCLVEKSDFVLRFAHRPRTRNARCIFSPENKKMSILERKTNEFSWVPEVRRILPRQSWWGGMGMGNSRSRPPKEWGRIKPSKEKREGKKSFLFFFHFYSREGFFFLDGCLWYNFFLHQALGFFERRRKGNRKKKETEEKKKGREKNFQKGKRTQIARCFFWYALFRLIPERRWPFEWRLLPRLSVWPRNACLSSFPRRDTTTSFVEVPRWLAPKSKKKKKKEEDTKIKKKGRRKKNILPREEKNVGGPSQRFPLAAGAVVFFSSSSSSSSHANGCWICVGHFLQDLCLFLLPPWHSNGRVSSPEDLAPQPEVGEEIHEPTQQKTFFPPSKKKKKKVYHNFASRNPINPTPSYRFSADGKKIGSEYGLGQDRCVCAVRALMLASASAAVGHRAFFFLFLFRWILPFFQRFPSSWVFLVHHHIWSLYQPLRTIFPSVDPWLSALSRAPSPNNLFRAEWKAGEDDLMGTLPIFFTGKRPPKDPERSPKHGLRESPVPSGLGQKGSLPQKKKNTPRLLRSDLELKYLKMLFYFFQKKGTETKMYFLEGLTYFRDHLPRPSVVGSFSRACSDREAYPCLFFLLQIKMFFILVVSSQFLGPSTTRSFFRFALPTHHDIHGRVKKSEKPISVRGVYPPHSHSRRVEKEKKNEDLLAIFRWVRKKKIRGWFSNPWFRWQQSTRPFHPNHRSPSTWWDDKKKKKKKGGSYDEIGVLL